MEKKTVIRSYGLLNEKELFDLNKVNRELYKLTNEGIMLNVPYVLSKIEALEKDSSRGREVRTLKNLLDRADEDGRIYPQYDLFKKGRTFIYSVYPNLSASFSENLFDEVFYPVSLKGDPSNVLSEISLLLDKGLRIGPVIGEKMFLRVS